MRTFSFFIAFLTSFLTIGQVEFDKVKHDFGELEPYSIRYVDLKLTNHGSKDEWLLSIKKPAEVVYIQSQQQIKKDSTIIVRLQVNPREKGRFSYKVEIYTSDRMEPVIVKLSGIMGEDPQNDMSGFTACPNFDERPGGYDPTKFNLTVVTIDKETREPLAKSTVWLIQNGMDVWTKATDKKGKIVEESTLGLSYFYATHEGYKPAELGAYINFKRNYIVLELEKDPRIGQPVIVEVPEDTVSTEEPVVIEIEEEPVVAIEEELANEETSVITEEVPPAFTELDENNFDEQYFDPVNVVFVLDVSSSMKQADKMELMKYALYQLADMLRPQDKFGIVTYASDAQVLLKPTSGANKDEINEQIEKLKAYGFTSGGSGIKLGFKQAKKAKIEDGVNQVIVITDGAFNRNSTDYKKYVRKYARKGIHMSVVGVKIKDVDEKEMREAAELGQGHFVPIQKLSDAQRNLKKAIRLLSFKY